MQVGHSALHAPCGRLLDNCLPVQVELLADGNGGFIRMMGFELGVGEEQGPKCQRFAGIVDDGVLLKVVSFFTEACNLCYCVCMCIRTLTENMIPLLCLQRNETTPIELKQTDCRSMLQLWDDVYTKKKHM